MVFPFRNHTYKTGHYNSFSSPLHDDKSENPETLLFHRSSHRQLPHSSWPVPDPSSPGYPEKYTVGDLLMEHFHQLHACGFQNTGYTAIIPGYPHIILPLTDIHCLLRLHTLFQLYQTWSGDWKPDLSYETGSWYPSFHNSSQWEWTRYIPIHSKISVELYE